jgi:hypothetical protein
MHSCDGVRVAPLLRTLLSDRTRGLQSTMSDLGGDGSDTHVRTLGIEGEKFKYASSACPITVGGISAAKGDLTELLAFLQAQ